MIFPELQGSNLHRQKITLPADLQGELNILFIPFYQWHQNLVDAWVPLARQLEMELPGVAYYELPVIRSMNILSRTFINEGMRAGIPDPISRERTITLYLDKDAFRRMLDMPDEETIYILVVDREGNVVWRAQGAYSEEKGAQLTGALQEILYVKAGYEQ
jgi:hypothetical protein